MADNSSFSIVSLSERVTVHIFKRLDLEDLYRVSNTCSKWKKLAKHGSLWITPRIGERLSDPDLVRAMLEKMDCMEKIQTFKLNYPMDKPVDNLLGSLEARCESLHMLRLRDQTVEAMQCIANMLGPRSKLNELELKNVKVITARNRSFNQYRYIFLRKLTIENCDLQLTKHLLKKCQCAVNLCCVHIDVTPVIMGLVSEMIRNLADSLQILHVFGSIDGKLLHQIFQCKHLITLSLRCSNDDADRVLPTREDWLGCEIKFSLNYLCVQNLLTLEGTALERICASSPNLDCFSVINCMAINARSIQLIVLNCKLLQHLEFKLADPLGHSAVDCFLDDNLIKYSVRHQPYGSIYYTLER